MEEDVLSASQVQQFIDCPRKWGFKYLEKLETPPHSSALLGTEVHVQLEQYLRDGKTLDFTRPSGEIAAALLPLLPASKTANVRNERAFQIPSPTGEFAYRGFIDLYAPDSRVLPGLVVDDPAPLVSDFKTTSNLAYAHTSDTLKTNVQAQLYAMAIMFEEPTDVVDLVWLYTRTRGAKRAHRVHLRVLASHVAEQFRRIDEIGARVVAIKSANPKVDELKPNVRMCEAYGGCPYRYRCNLSPAVHAAGFTAFEGNNMSPVNTDFLASLRKSVPSTPSMAAVAAPVTAHAVLTQTAPAPAPAPTVAPAPAPAPAATIEALPTWATAPVDPRRPAVINPPESLLPPAPPVGVTAPVPESTSSVAVAEGAAKRQRQRAAKAAEPAAPGAIDYQALAKALFTEFVMFVSEGVSK